tara:strand:+ start:71 stop:367 length:297 start_codon:yes stop_codon:yes gene_type:complete
MIPGFIALFIIYLLHKYITAWIKYFNETDERFGDSVWRWSYDYQVKGVRDISDLDDKEFVRRRRIRNRTISFMYWNFFIGFTVSMYLISDILAFILNN